MDSNYTLTQTLRCDDELILWRGHRNCDQLPVLVATPVLAHPSATTLTRLTREYALRGELDASYAAQALALVSINGQTSLVLTDFGGVPLDQLLTQRLDIPVFLRLAIGVTLSLAQLHGQNMIHKDIKPDNILIDPQSGASRLMGCGMASRVAREQQTALPTAPIDGSFSHMAPEQTGRLNLTIDSRSDLYSLGITFYQMLTGMHPFSASDSIEWIHCHIARQPTPPCQLHPDIPITLSNIVVKLIAKAAEHRYQTAQGLLADLSKCLADWQAKRRIADFPLGQNDSCGRLHIPEKLYGREDQHRRLLAALERVATTGVSELVMISGYSGIGKSSLVNSFHEHITTPGALFIAGKFDQHKRNIPYAALAQAFQALVRHMLCQGEAELAVWRLAIQSALGMNGQLIIDLIPDLRFVIGEQSVPTALAPAEAKNRFQMVLQKFLAVFALAGHPLILFLDDLQWIDSASIMLIEHLATDAELHHFLLIGAYRNNHIDHHIDHHIDPAPLTTMLDTIKKRGAKRDEMVLAPLTRRDVERLVSDTLLRNGAAARASDAVNLEIGPNANNGDTGPLAQMVYDKTAGNPFFVLQFLTRLAEDRLLVFKPGPGGTGWTWDLASIHQQGFSDNVVDLMVDKLRSLPESTLETIKLFACLGRHSDLHMIALVCGKPATETYDNLWQAVRNGLLQYKDNHYCFTHHRIQEAAYSLTPVAQLPLNHLKIGRVLLEKMRADTDMFTIINHCNHGIAHIGDSKERARLFDLNLLAGLKAKAAVAYASAQHYLSQAISLLPEDPWRSNYRDTYALYAALSECEYLLANIDTADAMFELVFSHSENNLDRAKISLLRMALYQVSAHFQDAVTVALTALKMFGIDFPSDEAEIALALQAENSQLTKTLKGREISTLLDLPLVENPETHAIAELLSETTTAIHSAMPNLFQLFILKSVNFSLRHGNSGSACLAYNSYAVLLVSLGNIPKAFEFSSLSVRLNERLKDGKRTGRLLFFHGVGIYCWRQPMAGSIAILERAFAAFLQTGDLPFTGYCSYFISWHTFETSKSLDEVLAISEKYIGFSRKTHNEMATHIIQMTEQLVACLKGWTDHEASFEDNTFSEQEVLDVFSNAKFNAGLSRFYIMKQIAAFIYGQYPEALEYANLAAQKLTFMRSSLSEASHLFFHALALTAVYPTVERQVQREFMRCLRQHLASLQLWAESCPQNFSNRYLLLQAEIARIEGRQLDAMHLYDDAIAAAHENGFIQNQAMANELAANFYHFWGLKCAAGYLREAHYCYQQWGAEGKVKQLERRHPELLWQDLTHAHAHAGDVCTNQASSIEHLDTLSIVKASQVVSGVMDLPELVETLLRIVLEHAGAERGLLILPQTNTQEAQEPVLYHIKAEANTDHLGVHVDFLDTEVLTAKLPVKLPEMVLQYVIHTHANVILDDAGKPNPYSDDAYLAQSQARSVLCMPLLKQGRLHGVLYLENRLSPGVFTPGRVAVLELLASQAAISLESATLFNNLIAENERRKIAKAALQQHQDQLEVTILERTKELLHANSELHSSNAALNHANEELAQTGETLRAANRELLLSADTLRNLGDVGRDITANLDTEMVFEALQRHVGGLLNAPVLAIFRMSDDATALELVFGREHGQTLPPASINLADAPTSVAACAVSQRQEVLYELDEGGDQACHLTEKPPMRTSLFAPLIVDDRVLGVMSIQSDKKSAYGERERLIFRTLCAYGAIALANAEALAALHQAQSQLVQQEKLASLGGLVAGVAHEINTPLGNARMAISAVAKDLQSIHAAIASGHPSKTKIDSGVANSIECAEMALRNIVRAAALITSFEAVSVCIDSDVAVGLDLGDYLPEIAEVMRRQFESNGYVFEIKVENALFVHIVPAALTEGLSRILSNVLDHAFVPAEDQIPKAKADCIVRLTAKPCGANQVEIVVSDNGCGIAPAHLHKVFDPFFTTKSGSGGHVGLGLHIAFNHVTQRLKGTLTVNSEIGHGTSVTICLPRALGLV